MKNRPQRRKDAKMKLLRILAFAFLIFTFIFSAFAQDDTRISATWQVQKYDINATLPTLESDRNLTVKAKIDLKNVSSKPASSLTFRISPNATVSAVTINNSPADFTKSEEKLGTASLQRIAIRIPSVAPGGSVSATVDYKLTLKDNSGLNSISPAGSQFLPMSFWYPTPNSWYFARGADYAGTRVQVTAPGQTFVSSGVESAGSFDQKLNIQPFFVSGNWDLTNSSGVSVYLPKGSGVEEQKRAAELAALASEAKMYITGLLGTAPDTPLRLVAVGRGAGFYSGGTILFDQAILRRGKIDSLTAMNISEATAKLWIGESVTVNGDGYGVIREGLPRFIATEFIETKYGKDVAEIEWTRQRNAYASVSRRDAPLMMVAPLDDYYFPAVANKGALLWRLLAKKTGEGNFFNTIKTNSRSGTLNLTELRTAFSSQKDFLDQMLDQITDSNFLVGLPQPAGSETKVALRNTGGVDVTVNVATVLSNGEKMSAPATIRAKSFGEITFKTATKIVRVEIDPEKFYPQTDYSDDVAPRETTESDSLLGVKRFFDKQEFANAEKAARAVLQQVPRFDDVRILLARSLLAQNKNVEAEREFRAALDEKLPTSRTIAWANVGLAETALRAGQNPQAVRFAEQAILADAEYGASLAARIIRNKVNAVSNPDESVKAYFTQFDRVAISNRKADLDAIVMPGEVTRFANGISGQTTEWKTQVNHVDKIDTNTVLVETAMTIKLLNREVETGMAVYRLSRVGGGWKLSGVEIFEVR
ncbi:MAG: hypothetical protein ACT4O9_09965 [Blastocatellia bacterium]